MMNEEAGDKRPAGRYARLYPKTRDVAPPPAETWSVTADDVGLTENALQALRGLEEGRGLPEDLLAVGQLSRAGLIRLSPEAWVPRASPGGRGHWQSGGFMVTEAGRAVLAQCGTFRDTRPAPPFDVDAYTLALVRDIKRALEARFLRKVLLLVLLILAGVIVWIVL